MYESLISSEVIKIVILSKLVDFLKHHMFQESSNTSYRPSDIKQLEVISTQQHVFTKKISTELVSSSKLDVDLIRRQLSYNLARELDDSNVLHVKCSFDPSGRYIYSTAVNILLEDS